MIAADLPPLLSMSRAELEDLYRRSPAGEIPDGFGQGAAIVAAGTPITRPVAGIIRRYLWQGKRFDRKRGELLNSITAFRLLAIRAQVYHGRSRLDGQESLILDYSKTSLSARWVRDEIREVSPGVYLGLAYLFKFRVVWFALVFPPAP